MDQQVYVVHFDGNGVVAGVDRKELADGRDIEPVPGATPAPGRELTFLEQVLGNMGRFNKSESASSGPEEKAPGPNPTAETTEKPSCSAAGEDRLLRSTPPIYASA